MIIESNLSYERKKLKRTNSVKQRHPPSFPRSFFPRAYMHTFTYGIHMCETPTCVRPIRVIMRVLACTYVNYFMHVRAPLLVPFPLFALALIGVPKKAGKRKVAIKESSYFVPHEEKQRAVSIPPHLSGSSPLFVFKDVP